MTDKKAQAELARAKRYAGRLMPEERRKISGEGPGKGDYRSFHRKSRPSFKVGHWLQVSPSHKIQIAEVQLRKGGGYRCIIGRVVDDRQPGPRIKAKQRNEEGMTETEPEGVDVRWLNRFRDEAEITYRDYVREAIEG